MISVHQYIEIVQKSHVFACPFYFPSTPCRLAIYITWQHAKVIASICESWDLSYVVTGLWLPVTRCSSSKSCKTVSQDPAGACAWHSRDSVKCPKERGEGGEREGVFWHRAPPSPRGPPLSCSSVALDHFVDMPHCLPNKGNNCNRPVLCVSRADNNNFPIVLELEYLLKWQKQAGAWLPSCRSCETGVHL